MLIGGEKPSTIDPTTIDLIADRVRAALHDDLEALAAELFGRRRPEEQLTVGQVAQRLGVARSTVYAHWREWGGYKLGPGDKAPIRFDSSALLSQQARPGQASAGERSRGRARRTRLRGDLLADAPRLDRSLDEIA